jgi:hypothetical protein
MLTTFCLKSVFTVHKNMMAALTVAQKVKDGKGVLLLMFSTSTIKLCHANLVMHISQIATSVTD